MSGEASHWLTHAPQLQGKGKGETRKTGGAPTTLSEAPTSLGVEASGPHNQAHQAHGGTVCLGHDHAGTKVNKHTPPNSNLGREEAGN